jgi:alpha-methylacyl-CoA racemase
VTGPLRGVKVLELGAIGPVPFCGLLLSDLGADIVRLDRCTAVAGADPAYAPGNVLDRGRRSVAVDLKSEAGVELALELVAAADVLLEGWRPGVAERLGIGPAECHERNPKLVYGRMTGFGQDGPWATRAGHDINYLALAGALSAFGRAGGPPVPPLNTVADFGGGGMVLALGVVAALFEVRGGGAGQVVDATMVDGVGVLFAPFFAARQIGFWGDRGTNLLDSGAPFYDSYECADGGWISVGALEPQFYAALLEGLGLDPADLPDRDDRTRWPELRTIFERTWKARTRDEWAEVFGPGGPDACVAPVLGLDEAPDHPHNVARGGFQRRENGIVHPSPAPRFSGTPTEIAGPSPYPGQHTRSALADWGVAAERIDELEAAAVIAQHPAADTPHT